MPGTKGKPVSTAVIVDGDYEEGDRVIQKFELTRKAKQPGQNLLPVMAFVVLLIATLSVFAVAAYLMFIPNLAGPGAPEESLPITASTQVPALQDNPKAKPAEETVEAKAETVIVQPTVNPMLLAGDPQVAQVSADVLVSRFSDLVTLHVSPANIGLVPVQTGNQVFDAAVAMKYSYANSDAPEVMGEIMRNAGDYIKAEAGLGNEFAIALRIATYSEFKGMAQSVIPRIPDLDEDRLFPTANDFVYYTAGMGYLAVTPEEYAERERLINEAAKAFADRRKELEVQRAALLVNVNTDNQAAPYTQPTQSAELLANQQPNLNTETDTNQTVAAAPEISPDIEAVSETSPRMVAPDLTAVTVRTPTLSDYSTFPEAIAAPLKSFSGLSLNPEGVVLAIQQFVALLKTGTAGAIDEWVVWNTYGTSTPFGKVWLFTMVELSTLQSRWGEMSVECQNYLGPLLENPSTPNAWDLRQRWGLNSCAEFMGGQVFNEGMSKMVNFPSGTTEYYLHSGTDGKVDVMGAIWFGFGEEFPFKVGHRVRPISLVNIGEGLFKDLFSPP